MPVAVQEHPAGEPVLSAAEQTCSSWARLIRSSDEVPLDLRRWVRYA